MFKKQKSLIGLDIGAHAAKAIELTQIGNEYVVTAYAQTDLPSDGSKADAIVDMLSGHVLRTRRVATAVSGKSVIVRYLTMVHMSDDDLRNAIKFEADKYIPFDIDEVVLDAHRLHDGGRRFEGLADNEMRVLLVAVKRSLIEDHVGLVQSIGLLPALVDVDAFALGNAFEFRSHLAPSIEQDHRVSALIDVGAHKTNINVLRGGALCFTREIYLGGTDFTSAASKRLGCEMHQAETLKRQPGDNIEALRDAVLPTIDDLGNEIHLSFDYFENQFDQPVDDVFLSGGGVELPLVAETFEKIFEKRTRHWDPVEHLRIDEDAVDIDALRANAGQLAIATGLACRLRKD